VVKLLIKVAFVSLQIALLLVFYAIFLVIDDVSIDTR
jgi:hypothetical protein